MKDQNNAFIFDEQKALAHSEQDATTQHFEENQNIIFVYDEEKALKGGVNDAKE